MHKQQAHQSFWDNQSKPIIGLSPMDGVTDHPYRFIQKLYGHPDLIYTEFSSVEGITHGSSAFLKEFLFDETQRPVISQIYGTDPQAFYEATVVACELGFDGVDINMGCPAKNVAHRGAGAGLITNPRQAQEIIANVKRAILDWSNGQTLLKGAPSISHHLHQQIQNRHSELPSIYQQPRSIPVSIKTRIGYDKQIITEWIPYLLEMNVAAITIHGRTLKQQYSGKANWSAIGEAALLAKQTQTKIIGNGDVSSWKDAQQKIQQYQVDGVLIGRASFGNPFIFRPALTEILNPPDDQRSGEVAVSDAESNHADNSQLPPIRQLAQVAVKHAEVFERSFQQFENYSFMPMRKHLGWYIRGIPNASEVRSQLFKTNSAAEVKLILQQSGLF